MIETEPPQAVICSARDVLNWLPSMPLYALMDGVMVKGQFVLCGLALIEPGLFFSAVPDAASRFGKTIPGHADFSAQHQA